MSIFRNEEDRRAYLSFIGEETSRFGVEILSWCLMTNHTHFVAVPQNSDSLARAFGETHRRYTRMRNFAEGVRGYLFQGRFGSCVLDERHLLAAVRYVEMNPVRAGIVGEAWEYGWSSASFHIGKTEADPLVKDRTLLGLVKDWNDFLSGPSSAMESAIRKFSRTGRPAGDGSFIGSVERMTGRDLSMRKPGRPPKTKD
jgi:putative transposase